MSIATKRRTPLWAKLLVALVALDIATRVVAAALNESAQASVREVLLKGQSEDSRYEELEATYSEYRRDMAEKFDEVQRALERRIEDERAKTELRVAGAVFAGHLDEIHKTSDFGVIAMNLDLTKEQRQEALLRAFYKHDSEMVRSMVEDDPLLAVTLDTIEKEPPSKDELSIRELFEEDMKLFDEMTPAQREVLLKRMERESNNRSYKELVGDYEAFRAAHEEFVAEYHEFRRNVTDEIRRVAAKHPELTGLLDATRDTRPRDE